MAADYAYASATQTLKALADGSVSSVELVKAAIARIERMDNQINAVVVRDFDRALRDAAESDMARKAGKAGALLGLPMTVKESFDLVGYPTTWGLEPFRGHIATEDAESVRRLRQAGAVILGKTNVPPALGDWLCDNPIYGRTNNPRNVGYSPGGSSGGAAAALAAGYVPLEMGSDIGGSIRIPAAFCGVYGHKSSWGIVPEWGQSPGGLRSHHPMLSVTGPLARTAEDLALGLGVMAGAHGPSASGWTINLTLPRKNKLSEFRVLIIDEHPRCKTSSSMKGALAALGERLRKAGTHVETSSDLLPDLGAMQDAYIPMLLTIITRGTPGAKPPSAHEWLGMIDAQMWCMKKWETLFRTFDIIVVPSFGTASFPHPEESVWEKRQLTIDGVETRYGDQLAWPSVATYPHLPATGFPIGHDGHLPLGAQAIGAFGNDFTTIAFAGMAGFPFSEPMVA